MRFHVIHAHPVETSFNRSLFHIACEALEAAGHEVDALNLYEENFDAVMSREERLNYHNVPDNITDRLRPYVDRLLAAEGIVFVHPVWNFGYPAILKGYFDRVFMPGVSFEMSEGTENGRLLPKLTKIKRAAFVTTYGGTRWRSMIMGDPPRLLAGRWAWVTFRKAPRPKYLALYDMNNNSEERLKAFQEKVRRELSAF
ncbi:MAG: NAD(P)H-dependent oxidoreductase [Rhizobiaceae bacterium]|nr:NAD(P)H-dependent oxidoreductase [Rhizobiaceae bacterium]